jgi:3D (Asp-Asp-Asp) domain-containing protein
VTRLWICAVVLVLGAVVLPGQTRKHKTPRRSFQATAYSLKGATATGTRARKGVVAADPRLLPHGSVVEVKGAGRYSGRYKVADAGPGVKGHKVDIFVPNQQKARQFGRKKVRVKVLKRGNSKESPD